jgi:hypothetical protein
MALLGTGGFATVPRLIFRDCPTVDNPNEIKAVFWRALLLFRNRVKQAASGKLSSTPCPMFSNAYFLGLSNRTG